MNKIICSFALSEFENGDFVIFDDGSLYYRYIDEEIKYKKIITLSILDIPTVTSATSTLLDYLLKKKLIEPEIA